VIAAHGVKRDANLIGHGSTLAALKGTPAARSAGFSSRPRP
jgi:hypothetical protein